MTDYLETPRVTYEGPDARDPLAFKWYNPDERLEGKAMRDHLRFSAAYWHTMRGAGADPFGDGTMQKPWDDGSDTLTNAKKRAKVFFEFLNKMQLDFYCFHDRDIAPEGNTVRQSNKNLESVVKELKRLQRTHGKQLLWGTACLFGHPRYMHGAGTSCSLDAYAHAASQVKNALEATHELDGNGYVFWGGREGYATLLNTDMKREREHLARFLHMAVEHKKKIGFQGPFYIEPKPQEPMSRQYDSDAAACLNFLREFDLLDAFQLNIETNHATLAGYSVDHELRAAANAGALGSVDANMGTPHVGWDTDQFPTDVYTTFRVMRTVLDAGGFTAGGLNFDAKRRRESFEPVDLFHAHVAGMDAFARGLRMAVAARRDGRLDAFVRERYRSWESKLGRKVERGKSSLEEMEAHAIKVGEPKLESGRQEMLEAIVNDYLR